MLSVTRESSKEESEELPEAWRTGTVDLKTGRSATATALYSTARCGSVSGTSQDISFSPSEVTCLVVHVTPGFEPVSLYCEI